MYLEAVSIEGLRNLSYVFFEPDSKINWITGRNGSGKTSLLEGIFLLARGRSFRGPKHGPLIKEGQSELRVAGRIRSGRQSHRRDLFKSTGGVRLFENGERLERKGKLGRIVQVRIITENAQKLVEGDPALRRLFLDWSLFHVEPAYGELLRGFRRALFQRNAWLRSGASGRRIWDDQLVDYAEQITDHRARFSERLDVELRALSMSAPAFIPVAARLRPGWPREQDLRDVLRRAFDADRARGYTQFGPSRADLEIVVNQARGVGSRGQNKVAVCLLQLAAQRISDSAGTKGCVWLLDDPSAELGADAFEAIWELFAQTKQQMFVTSPGQQDSVALQYRRESALFHVEQGNLFDAAHDH